MSAVDQIVHPVKTTKKSRLAAAGGTDKCGHSTRWNLQIDVEQHLAAAVTEVDIIDFDHCALAHFRLRRLLWVEGRGGMNNLFFHYYHDKRLLVRSRSTMDASAMQKTTSRRMHAAPYCTRSVYSFCGIFELTT